MFYYEGSEASVASSSPTPNWWEIHTNPISSWNAMNHRWQPHPSSSCEDQDMSNISTTSFTNASNHSGLSMDSSSAELSTEPGENHLWSQVLFGAENGGGDLNNNHNDTDNFLKVLTSKNLTTEMFNNPACDYLKKLDSSWDQLTNHTQINPLDHRQLNSYNNGALIEPERLTTLSDLVSNWSIAPPNSTCNVPLNPSMAQFSPSNISQIKHENPNFSSYLPPYHQDHIGSPFNNGGMGYQVALNNSMLGINNKFYNGISSENARNLSDLISFGSLNKPPMEFRASTKPSSFDSKKQGYETSSSTKGSGKSSGTTSEGKKKRSEDSSETLFKKSKHENSNASSVKLQPPKVKLGDRITALQQIVSPFGKTDTASVLLEAINYIRFLQEQVQLLSDPYMKSNANKDHNSWGGLERKEKGDPKLDLRSRGLCLVPVSCTPQVYRDNTGPDYWMPTYRGCLYR
ncbi:transcription factor bHLH111-like isoform X1 [Asparagus officinalis]|uniref:transcription factor bHLH111-like isoform X1 n=1 Tax=Asparagus officinalis TaxID=4686 RepID=UPI00098E6879|nr:transcription factor bHLH111-like isoform X1 [Asparagus officinalis]